MSSLTNIQKCVAPVMGLVMCFAAGAAWADVDPYSEGSPNAAGTPEFDQILGAESQAGGVNPSQAGGSPNLVAQSGSTPNMQSSPGRMEGVELDASPSSMAVQAGSVQKPRVREVRPCEVLGSCGKTDTLETISAMQQRRALLRAQIALEEEKLALSELRCQAQGGCSGQSNEPQLTPEQQQALFRASAQPELAVRSIYGRSGNYSAILVSRGGELAVQVGDRLPDGGTVREISEQAVVVNKYGNEFVLSVAGTSAQTPAQ